MGDPIHNAKIKKARLEAELAKIQADLKETEVFLSLASKFSNEPEPLPRPSRLPFPPLPKKLSVPDTVALMISDGFPMQTNSILDRLLSMGFEVGGGERSKQLTNLSSTLSRDSRFKNQRGIGWSLNPTPKVESPNPVSAGDGLDDL